MGTLVTLCLIPSGPSGVPLSSWYSPGGLDHCGADKRGYLLLRLAPLPSAGVGDSKEYPSVGGEGLVGFAAGSTYLFFPFGN